jgi:peptide/nickel transport system permease protein
MSEIAITRRPYKRSELIWLQFKKHKLAHISLYILGIFVVFVAFAEFLIPNSPFENFKDNVYVPPRIIRFVDQTGRFRLRPFIYAYKQTIDKNTWERSWAEDTDHRYNLRLFVSGYPYKLLGLIPARIHLLGLDNDSQPLLLFGSDKLGRDLFSRTIFAARVSISIAALGVIISLVLGIILGGISGYYGGSIDNIIQRSSELLLSIPKLPLWLALAAAIPSNWSVTNIYISIVVIISLMNWPGLARGIRSKLMSLKKEEFISAARSYGASNKRIIYNYLIPNFSSYIIVNITLAVPGMIMLETSLSFLGVGLRSPAVSWGVLLEQAQSFQEVILHLWLLIPGIFVIILVLALNFVGDGIRDAADPFERK